MDEDKVIKEKGECFPFICDRCKGFNDCEYTLKGICLCPWCDDELIDKYQGNV